MCGVLDLSEKRRIVGGREGGEKVGEQGEQGKQGEYGE